MREQIDYAVLKRNHPYDEVDSLLELLVDVLSSTVPTIRIGGETLPTAAVQERFQQLDSSHIVYILDSLKSTTTKIHNIRAYLLTALYHAPVTIPHRGRPTQSHGGAGQGRADRRTVRTLTSAAAERW